MHQYHVFKKRKLEKLLCLSDVIMANFLRQQNKYYHIMIRNSNSTPRRWKNVDKCILGSFLPS